ncbi:Polyketide synthase PksJ [Bacillus amyloliquefaciens]|uniref:AMP-binding protein n=1 Tax=Bacillus amyloliquefaciens TaxID=1390 RepID=UPI00080C80A9|nr:AMP-binding protein [Bacillus amyloliquefaciens]OCB93350.1 Polyketide synthase PksJ [Bacillus amyloliquefaciens]
MYKTVYDFIVDAENRDDKGITFINGSDKEMYIPYAQLFENARKVLGVLQKKGLKKKDELIIQIEDNEQFIKVFWACILGGIIPIPLSIGYNEEHKLKILRIWNILNNPYCISDQRTLHSLEKVADAETYSSIVNHSICLDEIKTSNEVGELISPTPEDIAFIQFSSGTTGDPKGVILTHKNLITNISALNEAWETSESDSSLSWMPLTHDMGLIAIHLASTYKKIQQYIIPTSVFIRRPTLWLLKTHQHRVTQLYSPNFGYKFLLDNYKKNQTYNWDLTCVRLLANGAEPISTSLCREFLEEMSQFGLKYEALNTVYGLAEATVAVSVPKLGKPFVPITLNRGALEIGHKIQETVEEKKGITFVEVGPAVQHCFLRICDSNNEVLEDDFIGHVQIKGENVTSGYYNNELATKDAITSDGWLNTGDLGFIHNNSLVITGRTKDIIIKNGQNYYAHDIERVAERVKDIELGNVVACGVMNEQKAEEDLVIFLKCKKSYDITTAEKELKRELTKQLGLNVHQVIPVRKIFKTTSGKVQRSKMKDFYKELILS